MIPNKMQDSYLSTYNSILEMIAGSPPILREPTMEYLRPAINGLYGAKWMLTGENSITPPDYVDLIAKKFRNTNKSLYLTRDGYSIIYHQCRIGCEDQIQKFRKELISLGEAAESIREPSLSGRREIDLRKTILSIQGREHLLLGGDDIFLLAAYIKGFSFGLRRSGLEITIRNSLDDFVRNSKIEKDLQRMPWEDYFYFIVGLSRSKALEAFYYQYFHWIEEKDGIKGHS